jgi:hypothetical protein
VSKELDYPIDSKLALRINELRDSTSDQDQLIAEELIAGVEAGKALTDGDELGAIILAPAVWAEPRDVLTNVKALDFSQGNHPRVGDYPIITVAYDYYGVRMVGQIFCVHKVLFEQLAEINYQVGSTLRALANLGERPLKEDPATSYTLWRIVSSDQVTRNYDWQKRKLSGGVLTATVTDVDADKPVRRAAQNTANNEMPF